MVQWRVLDLGTIACGILWENPFLREDGRAWMVRCNKDHFYVYEEHFR